MRSRALRLNRFALSICCIGLAAYCIAQGAAPTAKPQAPAIPVRPADAVILPDGLAYKVLRPGTGTAHPKLSDTVSANYSVWKANGTFLESTCTAGTCKPASLPLDKLIPGWQEIIPMMTVGEKLQLWLTAALAYGDPPRKPNRPAGPLVFEIELVGIGMPTPPTPH